METSPHFTQEPVATPQVVYEPTDIKNIKSFDIADVTNMVQPSTPKNPGQVVTSAPESSHHVMHPESEEQIQSPSNIVGKLEVAPGVDGPRHVLRPDSEKRKGLSRRAKALAAAAIVGLSGAMMTDNAHAEDIQGGSNLLAGIVNSALAKTPFAVGVDSSGRAQAFVKSPAQMAINRPAAREQGVEQVAASMGLSIIEQGTIFSISRNGNPADNVTIQKYYDANHYTTAISIREAPNGGLLLNTSYVDNGQIHSQMSIINIDQTGKIHATVVGS
jgi:hypothetical protein